MALGLLGTKVGMTQVYNEKGAVEPVTVLQVGPCPVLQIRDKERDGYQAVQIGYLDKERRKANRAERGHVAGDLESKRRKGKTQAGVTLPPKANCEPQRYIREFRVEQPPKVKVGEELTEVQVGHKLTVTEVFGDVKVVDVIGTTKGRGYSGVMKRHNFHGMPAAHGAKKVHRQAGSTSSNASNRGSGRPKRGQRRAGQYGNEQVTIRHLKIVRIDAENNLLLVRGGIPGPNGGIVIIRPTNKKDIPIGGDARTAKRKDKKK